MNTMQHPDVVIAGAGVIGLSLALELRLRGRQVLVLDRGTPGLASRAAAGMLAAHDPHNPPALQPLANLAIELYPAYLNELRARSGLPVPIHTEHVLEPAPAGRPGHTLLSTLAPTAGKFNLRAEQSLDPRDLHTALSVAAEVAGIRVEKTDVTCKPEIPARKGNVVLSAAKNLLSSRTGNTFSFRPEQDSSTFQRSGETRISQTERKALARQQCIDCTGAWSPTYTRPAKGQMLRIQLPPNTLRLPHNGNAVLRTEHIYIVPRLDGSALIGATVEDAAFDLTLHQADLDHLRAQAAALVPAVQRAPELERWAGLRPRTADDLPILGQIAPNHYVANGLFRNGILLAPAVARVMAQLLSDEPVSVALDTFSPHRPALITSR